MHNSDYLMWLFIVLQCSIPQKLTFVDGVQLPFLSDCPEKSRGSLQIRGTLRNGTVFQLKSTNLTVQPRTAVGQTQSYFYYDIISEIAKENYAFAMADIAVVDIYANITIGKKQRIVAVSWTFRCSYGAQVVDGSITEIASKQYLVFPRSFNCYSFNFTQTQPEVYIKRFRSGYEDKIYEIKTDEYQLAAGVKINKNDPTQYNFVQTLRVVVIIGQASFSFDTYLSRSADEVAEAASLDIVCEEMQYHNCIAKEAADTMRVVHNTTHAVFTFDDYTNCYMNLVPYIISAGQPVLFQRRYTPYFYPYYVLQYPSGASFNTLEIYEYYPYLTDSTLTSLNKKLIHKMATSTVRHRVIAGYCNQSELQYYVEKPDFASIATVRRVYDVLPDGTLQYANDWCVDARAINVQLAAKLAQATALQFNDATFQSLPDVYLMRPSTDALLSFQFDDSWLRFELAPVIYLKFDLQQEVRFVTPALIENCLYTAVRAYLSGDLLTIISKYICSGVGTEIEGFSFEKQQNCRNASTGHAFDMFLCVTYRYVSAYTKLHSRLSDFYRFECEFTAPAPEIQPYEYVTAEEYEEQLAQLAEFETNNYDYMEWVARSWWVFVFIFVLVLLSFGLALYGCVVPCKYVFVALLKRGVSGRAVQGSFRVAV